MAGNNLISWLSGGTKGSELQETKRSWERAEAAWRASPLHDAYIDDLAEEIVEEALRGVDRRPAPFVISALTDATEALLYPESIGEVDPYWSVVETDIEEAIEFRQMVKRRTRWASDYGRMRDAFARELGEAYRDLVALLPEVCFVEHKDATDTFEVPLIDLLTNPAEAIEALMRPAFSEAGLSRGLFHVLRSSLKRNFVRAAGKPLERFSEVDFVMPRDSGKSARERADLYLRGTPFEVLLELPVPFTVPEEVRFEHCHVIGGTGHGKTQLLQRMIHADLVAAQYDRRSVVVIDSQGDLIQKLSRLELFSPHVGGGLGERLVLIDPADIEHPVALNLFDPHLERLSAYDPVDRERVLNGVVELYETFFDALLGAELTARQDVVFRYLARLMVTIPGATILTLMQLMEDGRAFQGEMAKLEGAARRFFETEFFSPLFAATKSQILRRLWGVLATPAFERMFSQKENKLDLFEALQSGKIILISTAKDFLKEEGSRLFGRFFMAMLAQATLERSTVSGGERTPTFVYVDEAQEYFDDRIETILGQARKYRVGLTLAHQTLDQLGTRLRSALLTNTSMKCAGGVSAKDARVLAEELHTTPEFIDGMRRKGPKTEFAIFVKHETPHAIRLSVPLGFLERQHTLDDEDYEFLLRENRKRYCGTAVTMAALPALALQAEVDEPRDVNEPDGLASQETQEPIAEAVPIVPAMRRPEFMRGQGKGGPRHRYLQGLVKELGEQAGFKATLEAPLQSGGQIDVLLEHASGKIAFEISVSTSPDYELDKVRRCFAAGLGRVAIVIGKARASRSRVEELVQTLPEEDRSRVAVLAAEDIPEFIASLAPVPEPSETVVKGYKVRVSHTALSPEEARVKRERLARIVAESLGS